MAVIIYKERQSDGKRIKLVSHAEAKKLQLALAHPERITDAAQRAKLASIQAVYLASQTVAEEYGIKPNSGLKG